MKILVVGGGSGGHVTPVIAVVKEIWKKHPRAKVEFWTDKKYYRNVRKIAIDGGLDLRVKKIAAGKLRRYTHYTFVMYLQHFDIVIKNFIDLFKIAGGFLQAFFRLLFMRPDVVFLKGGYVCLPVGVAARFLRIPYIIHDSDAAPGLANRLLSKKATKIATGMPLKYYKYDEERAEWTGIPVSEEFKPAGVVKQRKYKKELGFDTDAPLTVVTGGSLGAKNINFAVREILPEMLKKSSVLLVAGRERYPEMLDLKKYEEWEKGVLCSNFRMLEFSSEMWKLFSAADLVISRAGASTMTELAAMHKTVIMVPNHKLPGYHQVKNAKNYEEANAALVVSDSEMFDNPQVLLDAFNTLIRSPKKRETLAKNLAEFAKDDAAERIADMVIRTAKK